MDSVDVNEIVGIIMVVCVGGLSLGFFIAGAHKELRRGVISLYVGVISIPKLFGYVISASFRFVRGFTTRKPAQAQEVE